MLSAIRLPLLEPIVRLYCWLASTQVSTSSRGAPPPREACGRRLADLLGAKPLDPAQRAAGVDDPLAELEPCRRCDSEPRVAGSNSPFAHRCGPTGSRVLPLSSQDTAAPAATRKDLARSRSDPSLPLDARSRGGRRARTVMSRPAAAATVSPSSAGTDLRRRSPNRGPVPPPRPCRIPPAPNASVLADRVLASWDSSSPGDHPPPPPPPPPAPAPPPPSVASSCLSRILRVTLTDP